MGGSSKTSTSTASTTTNPWSPTVDKLKSVLDLIDPNAANVTGNETNALNALTSNAQAGNPYAPAIGQLATDLLSGGTDRTGYATNAYNDVRSGLLPYTTMDTNPYSNPAFVNATSTLTNDIADRIKSSYAGAGYSPVRSGDFAQSLGRGVAQGVAPTWLNAYNDLTSTKLGAINSLYNAGNSTAGILSGLDQTSLANREAGIGASTAAQQAKDSPFERLLQIEAMKRSLPLQNTAQLESLLIPPAQLGGTSQTDQTTTTEQKTPLGQQIFGGILGGLGTLGNIGAFGPTGWLLGGSGGLLGGAGAAGGAASGLTPLLAFSDRRVKTDIRKIGRLDNGLPFYMFRYIGDHEPRFGVMAQDVEKVSPDAVIERNGIKMVDYEKAVRVN